MSTVVFPSSSADRVGGASWIRGVCAEIAARAGVAVWVPRVVFTLFAVLHWFLAVVLYFVLARIMRRHRRADRRDRQQADWRRDQDTNPRFRALDERLAEFEAANLQQEAALRRQFRDL